MAPFQNRPVSVSSAVAVVLPAIPSDLIWLKASLYLHRDPWTGPRLTVTGQATAIHDPRRLARFTAHHPASTLYSGFADFRLYRVAVERGHLVAGFGRIHWIEGRDLLEDAAALAAAEPEILGHMNEYHADAIADYARGLLGRAGTDWRMIGIDPEGADLQRDGETVRLDFGAPC
jgi:hypothetical protein